MPDTSANTCACPQFWRSVLGSEHTPASFCALFQVQQQVGGRPPRLPDPPPGVTQADTLVRELHSNWFFGCCGRPASSRMSPSALQQAAAGHRGGQMQLNQTCAAPCRAPTPLRSTAEAPAPCASLHQTLHAASPTPTAGHRQGLADQYSSPVHGALVLKLTRWPAGQPGQRCLLARQTAGGGASALRQEGKGLDEGMGRAQTFKVNARVSPHARVPPPPQLPAPQAGWLPARFLVSREPTAAQAEPQMPEQERTPPPRLPPAHTEGRGLGLFDILVGQLM